MTVVMLISRVESLRHFHITFGPTTRRDHKKRNHNTTPKLTHSYILPLPPSPCPFSVMSYAQVAANNAPPISEQPHPDPALFQTAADREPTELPSVDTKVAVAPADYKEHPKVNILCLRRPPVLRRVELTVTPLSSLRPLQPASLTSCEQQQMKSKKKSPRTIPGHPSERRKRKRLRMPFTKQKRRVFNYGRSRKIHSSDLVLLVVSLALVSLCFLSFFSYPRGLCAIPTLSAPPILPATNYSFYQNSQRWPPFHYRISTILQAQSPQ